MIPQPLALVLRSPILNTCNRQADHHFDWPVSSSLQSDYECAKTIGRQVVCVILEQGHFIQTACTIINIEGRLAHMIVLHRARRAMVVAESLNAVLTTSQANEIFGWLQEHSYSSVPMPTASRTNEPWRGLPEPFDPLAE